MSYCCDSFEAKDISSIPHEAGIYHLCVRCTISFENMAHSRERPNRLLAARTESRRKVQSLKDIAGVMSDPGQRQGRDRKLGEATEVLSQKSLAKRSSFLEQLNGEHGSVMEDLFSSIYF